VFCGEFSKAIVAEADWEEGPGRWANGGRRGSRVQTNAGGRRRKGGALQNGRAESVGGRWWEKNMKAIFKGNETLVKNKH